MTSESKRHFESEAPIPILLTEHLTDSIGQVNANLFNL